MTRKIKAIFSLAILLMLGCSDKSISPGDFNQYSGIWVPYEIRYADGRIHTGPFINMSIFGVYAESVHLNEDKTYTPVIWQDADNYDYISNDEGNIEYASYGTKLFFTEGAWNMEFEITKYENDDLWLTYAGGPPLLGDAQTLYKLKREIK